MGVHSRNIAFVFALLLPLICAAENVPRVTITPKEDLNAVLHNPDMGWVVYADYPLLDAPAATRTTTQQVNAARQDFPGVDNAAIMFTWSDVETRQDQYDFSKVDAAYDHWKRLGKSIQMRMSTQTLLWWNNAHPPAGIGAPQYVLDHIPASQKQRRVMQGFTYDVVDARNPFYRERLAKFLSVVAKHFGSDRPVTLVDLRGFGVWGEWHSGFRYASESNRREALCGIIDIYAKAFPHHWLALSYSHDPDDRPADYAGPSDHFDPAFTSTYRHYVQFSAFDYAMTRPNITLRRDGVGGAVYSNERKFNEQAFATGRKGPMSCEFIMSYADAKKGGAKKVHAMLADATSLHANYINLLGYSGSDAAAFLQEQPNVVADGLRKMGYRFVPINVSLPQTVRFAAPMTIDMTWINQGVGRAMRDVKLEFSLADANGKIIGIADSGTIPTSHWIAQNHYPIKLPATFPAAAPGHYELCVRLTDPFYHRPLELPLKRISRGWYLIGDVNCQ